MLAWTGGKRKLLEASQNFTAKRSPSKWHSSQRSKEETTTTLCLTLKRSQAPGPDSTAHMQLTQCQCSQPAALGSSKVRCTLSQGQSIDIIMCNGGDATNKEDARNSPAWPQALARQDDAAAAALGCRTCKDSIMGTTSRIIAESNLSAHSKLDSTGFITPTGPTAATAQWAAAQSQTEDALVVYNCTISNPRAAAPPVTRPMASTTGAPAPSYQHKPALHVDWQQLHSNSYRQHAAEASEATFTGASGTQPCLPTKAQINMRNIPAGGMQPPQELLAVHGSLQDSSKQSRRQLGSYDLVFLGVGVLG